LHITHVAWDDGGGGLSYAAISQKNPKNTPHQPRDELRRGMALVRVWSSVSALYQLFTDYTLTVAVPRALGSEEVGEETSPDCFPRIVEIIVDAIHRLPGRCSPFS
jgi:hypothetical protein